jgi:hypothetical protein
MVKIELEENTAKLVLEAISGKMSELNNVRNLCGFANDRMADDYADLESAYNTISEGLNKKETKGMSLEEYVEYLYAIYNSAGGYKEHVDLYIITRGNTERLDGKYLHYGVLDESLVDDIVLTLRDKINGKR